jgi:hypothetical protein
MTFSIEMTGVTISATADHNKNGRSFNLRSIYQANLPLNEYFYLKVKGIWKNTKDSSDTIEYYLIYACRYVSKLVLALSPNSKVLLKGQTLTIDHSAKFMNMKTDVKDKSYTVSWVCPGKLQSSCANHGNTLKLNYEDVLQAGIEFWKPQTITLIAQTNFI